MSDEEVSAGGFFDALFRPKSGYDLGDFGGRVARYQDFNAVFGSKQGQRVMLQILQLCGVNKLLAAAVGPVNPYRTHINEGRRSVALTIMEIMNDVPVQRPTTTNPKAKE